MEIDAELHPLDDRGRLRGFDLPADVAWSPSPPTARPEPESREGKSVLSMKSIVRVGADWTSVIEVAHAPAESDHAWAASVLKAAENILTSARGLGFTIVEHSADCASVRTVTSIFPPGLKDLLGQSDAGLDAIGLPSFRAFYYPDSPVTTDVEVEAALSDEHASVTRGMRLRAGVDGALAILAHPEPGVIILLSAHHDEPVTVSRHERRLLTRIALHLETSYRLRRRPEIVKAVLDPDGRVLHRDDDAPDAATLVQHVRTRGTSIELWPALVGGRCSLVERGTGKDRRYLVIENASAAQSIHALTEGEVDVISHAARGLPTKLIAYALGVSSPVVSARLARAAAKIGASSRMELVRIAAMLTRDPRARFPEIALTDAERDVLDLLQGGLSNEEIARLRSRSVRTIANQVASLLRKTKSSSRRELVVQPRWQG